MDAGVFQNVSKQGATSWNQCKICAVNFSCMSYTDIAPPCLHVICSEAGRYIRGYFSFPPWQSLPNNITTGPLPKFVINFCTLVQSRLLSATTTLSYLALGIYLSAYTNISRCCLDWWYSRSLFHWLKKNNSFQVHKNWQVRIAIAQQQCFINEPQNIHNLFTWRDALSSKISRTLHANVKVICGDWNRNMLSHQQLHVLFIAVLQQGLLASLIGSSEIYPSFSFLHVLVQNFPRYPSSG